MSGASLSPGFPSPVGDAQAAFRALLEATARPGSRATLASAAPPAPRAAAMAALALTLLDADTPVWLDEEARSGPAPGWLRFHCGCRIVSRPEDAAFALAAGKIEASVLARLPAGTDEYPDRGATAVLSVAAFGRGRRLRLAGPGIDGTATLAVAGLPAGFAAMRAANHRLFPRGVDHLLVAGGEVVALPRSTAVAEEEG